MQLRPNFDQEMSPNAAEEWRLHDKNARHRGESLVCLGSGPIDFPHVACFTGRESSGDMSDLFWLNDDQMARLVPCFPQPHGKPRVDDRRVLSGVIFINCIDLRWGGAPKKYDPHKTLYNRWKRWSERGILARIMMGLAAGHGAEKTVMIPSLRNFVSTGRQWTPPI